MCPNQQGVYKIIKESGDGKVPRPDSLTKNDVSLDTESTAAISTLIFQYLSDSATWPDVWETAYVVPIFKNGKSLML